MKSVARGSCYLGCMREGGEGLIYGFVAGQVANFAVLFISVMRHDRFMRCLRLDQVGFQALTHINYSSSLYPRCVESIFNPIYSLLGFD
jgi:hypothetical protein